MTDKVIPILIVDDDPVFAAYAQQLVASLGEDLPCESDWVDTGEKAMEELRLNRWELVLLDYHLPGANGLEMLNRIRELPPEEQPAVVMLTASGSESVAVEAMKRGALDYLTKADLDVAPLTRAVRSALSQKQLADQLEAYNAQMRADLEMARRLQQSMLPETYPLFPATAAPENSALKFAHRYVPAAELAGDFFSVLQISESAAGIFICDVMGHGIRSALVTALIRALVDGEAPRANDPGLFLEAINRRLTKLLRPDDGPMFATACYLIVETASGVARYATAGHPRPICVSAGGADAAFLSSPQGTGPALGLFEDAAYPTNEQPLKAGDLLLLFTDGLYEVPSTNGAGEFGKSRLLEAVKQHAGSARDSLCDALLEDVRRFTGGSVFADDVCLLSVEVARLQDRGL